MKKYAITKTLFVLINLIHKKKIKIHDLKHLGQMIFMCFVVFLNAATNFV